MSPEITRLAERIAETAVREAGLAAEQLEREITTRDAQIDGLLLCVGELLAHVERSPAGTLASASVRDTIAALPEALRRVAEEAEDEAKAARLSGSAVRLARAS